MSKHKTHFTVTISDVSRAYYIRIPKSIGRILLLIVPLVGAVIALSASYNYWQFQERGNLTTRAERIGMHNVSLSESLTAYKLEAQAVEQALVDIERVGDIDSRAGWISPDQRLQNIRHFYADKEAEYSVVSERVEQIEIVIDAYGGFLGSVPVNETASDSLLVRTDLATANTTQNRILHSSIPNGFPIRKTTITSDFGPRIHPVTKRNHKHLGIDLRARYKEDVHTTAEGIVRIANYSKFSGNVVVVQHNFGFETRYAHLSEMKVKPGDVVHRGDLIGVSGNSGRSAAPHLHYEVRYLGKPLDPSNFLRWEFGKQEIFTQVKEVKWPSLINLINKQITHQTLQLSQLDPLSPDLSK